MSIPLLVIFSMPFILGCTHIAEMGIINQTIRPQHPPSQLPTFPETGIYGTIILRTGDCMPMMCPEEGCLPSSCSTGPATGNIYVFNSTIMNNQTELYEVIMNSDTRKSIASTTLTEKGFYNISVPPGDYVLFFYVGSWLVCGQGDCDRVTVKDSYVLFDQHKNFATD